MNYQDHDRDLVVTLSTGNIHHIRLDSDIKESSYYRQVFNILDGAEPQDGILIDIITNGGLISTATAFVNKIRNCQAKVTANVYEACSAGALIMLACDDIVINRHAEVLIHTSWFGYRGKEPDVKAYVDHHHEVAKEFIEDLCDGFLTKKEITKVLDGRDIWLRDLDLVQRVEKLMVYRKKQVKEHYHE